MGVPQETKNRTIIGSSNPTPVYISERKKMKTLIQKVTCTPVFIAALLTMAKIWKQSKCLSTDKQIKKMWHIYAMEYYSAIKRMKFCHLQQCGWTYRILFLVKYVRQRKTNTVCYHLTWNLRNKTNECIQQNRNRLTVIQNKLVDAGGEKEGGMGKIGVWD